MEEQLEELKKDVARLTRIIGIQTVTIREILDSLQSIKSTMEGIVGCLEKLEEKIKPIH